MKKIVTVLSLSLFLVLGVSCSKPAETTTSSSSTVASSEVKDFEVTISIIEDEKEVDSKKASATEEETVMELTKKTYDVKEKGGLVSEINGIEQDAKNNKYWMFYVNDKEATKGANEVTVSKGDVIEWRLNEYK